MKSILIVAATAVIAAGSGSAFAQTKVCIDPGHGGSDPGASGNGQLEKTNALNTSLKFRNWLNADTGDNNGGGSWNVLMTRTGDTYPSLSARTSYANSNGVARFMSIHNNACCGASGTETFCHTSLGTSEDLRNKIQFRSVQAWGLTNRGNKTATFYVLTYTNMPATLAELGFITHATDAAFLGNAGHQDNMAKHHMYALQNHFGITAYTPGSTPPPANLGGVDACSWGSGRIDVFARGANNELRHKSYSGSWGAWHTEGAGTIASDPSAVSWGPNRIDIFARSSSGRLLHKWYNGSWSGWEDLGGSFVGSPDACSYEAGRLDVFVRGTDNAIWQKFYHNNTWSGWISQGGVLNSDPGASASPGRIDIYARGGSNNIYHKFWRSGIGWSGWINEGGTSASGPDATSWGSGRHDIFVRGGGDSVYHKYYENSTWSSYVSLGGITQGDPGACSWGPGRVDVFARGGGNDIYQKYLVNGVWSGSWTNLGH